MRRTEPTGAWRPAPSQGLWYARTPLGGPGTPTSPGLRLPPAPPPGQGRALSSLGARDKPSIRCRAPGRENRVCPNPPALSHGQMPPPPGTTSGGRTVSPKIHGRGLRPGPATQPRLEARAPQTQPGSDAAAGDRTCPRPPGGFGSEAAGGGTRRQDAGLKPTYRRRRGCGPTSCFMPLSSAPVDARPSMCLRCFERNEFHVSLSQTSPIGGAFAPGSQAQPPSPWTVARPRRLAPQPRGRRDLPPLASPASAGPRPVSRVPRPAWVGGIGA